MIQGLKVTVPGYELAVICKDRETYHLERVAAYAEQIKSMRASHIEGMQYTNGDPIKALEDKMRNHDAEAGELRFIAAHLISCEEYLLGREDLVKLGIASSRY